jgi:predicted DNA binding CopG/RHH family protein
MDVSGFDWDDGNRSKCQKHGVSIPEIEHLFTGAPMIAPDIGHSARDDRFIASAARPEEGGSSWPSPFAGGKKSASCDLSALATCTTRRGRLMIKRVPRMTTDEEAARFLDQDLSDLDFSQFKPVQFEFEAKDERVNMRLPKALLIAVKERASDQGIPYQRFIRQALERAVSAEKKLSAGS